MGFSSRLARHPQGLWLRRALFQIHLWSGIGTGLYIVVISVSGSVLVYRNELRAGFDPKPRQVAVTGPTMSEAALVAAGEAAYPEHQVWVYHDPEEPGYAVTLFVDGGEKKARILFDPYTGEDLGHAIPLGWRLTTWLLEFHNNLHGGAAGTVINGVGAIVVTLLSITGGIIWWPGIGRLRRSLTVDWKASWRRLSWRLHSASGIWLAAFVFLWGFTGIYLSFPTPFAAVVDFLEPLDPESFEPRVGDTALYWVAYLHFGRFGGDATKLLWAVLGLGPPFLFATGAVMWWRRVLGARSRK